MKSKLLKIVLLVAMVFIVSSQSTSPVNQVFSPAVVHQPKAATPPAGVKYLEKVEDMVIELTNRTRRAHGLAPLSKDDELTGVARAYSDDMLVRRFFDHTDPDGVTFDERISDQYPQRFWYVGENLWYAAGYNPAQTRQLAQEIVADWMNSPGHRANLLDPDFTHLGVGISFRNHTIRATQEFVGKPKGFQFWGLG